MIISQNENLLDVFQAFQYFCISYWYKSLLKIENNVPFFWPLLLFFFLKLNFCWSLFWILKLVMMLNYFEFLNKISSAFYSQHFTAWNFTIQNTGFKKVVFYINYFMICCISSIIIPFKTTHKTILRFFRNQYSFRQICEQIVQGCSIFN